MANSNGSSSDDCGGAPLYSPTKPTPNKPFKGHKGKDRNSDTHSPTDDEKNNKFAAVMVKERRNTSSCSPADDERALVLARGRFNQMGEPGPPPGPHSFTAQTPRSSAAFGHHASPFNQDSTPFNNNNNNNYRMDRPNNGPPRPAYDGNPMLQASADIQSELITAQQMFQNQPGIPGALANAMSQKLIKIGQDVNTYTIQTSRDVQHIKHQGGELRMQIERQTRELSARRLQISELQNSFKNTAEERDSLREQAEDLEIKLRISEGDVRRYKTLIKSLDEKHMESIQALEEEIKTLRSKSGCQSMQLVKASGSSPAIDSDNSKRGSAQRNTNTRPPISEKRVPNTRRRSSLNPEAPAFGARSTNGMLTKYDNESQPFENQHSMLQNDYTRTQNGGRGGLQADRQMQPRPATRNASGTTSGYTSSASDMYGNMTIMQRSNNRHPGPLTKMPTIKTENGFDSSSDVFNGRENLMNKADWTSDEVTQAFKRLYELIEGATAMMHCEAPFNETDRMLPEAAPHTWEFICAIGLANKMQSGSHMAHLLTEKGCRHYIVKRLFVDYIFHRMIQPEVFFGFSERMDNHLKALQQQMRTRVVNGASGRAQGKERQKVIEDHATIIQHLVESDDAREFRDMVIEKNTNLLLKLLAPMRNCSTSEEAARKHIRVVVNCAWGITTKVWTSGATVHFFFPETGSKFSFGQMTPLNNRQTPPEQLQYSQWRVMLVVTPTLSLRDDRNNTLRTSELMKSDVLVMK